MAILQTETIQLTDLLSHQIYFHEKKKEKEIIVLTQSSPPVGTRSEGENNF